MEKKKMAKALMITAALAGGMTLAESFFNEAQATGYNKKAELKWDAYGHPYYVCPNAGDNCRKV